MSQLFTRPLRGAFDRKVCFPLMPAYHGCPIASSLGLRRVAWGWDYRLSYIPHHVPDWPYWQCSRFIQWALYPLGPRMYTLKPTIQPLDRATKKLSTLWMDKGKVTKLLWEAVLTVVHMQKAVDIDIQDERCGHKLFTLWPVTSGENYLPTYQSFLVTFTVA